MNVKNNLEEGFLVKMSKGSHMQQEFYVLKGSWGAGIAAVGLRGGHSVIKCQPLVFPQQSSLFLFT